MLISILIIALSLVMFVFFFRCTCLLLLSAKMPQATESEATDTLSLVQSSTKITEESRALVIDSIHRSLERDYSRVIRSWRDGAGRAADVEVRILAADFRMMSVWYRVIRHVSQPHAGKALLEMTSIVNHLANAR